MKTTHAPWSVCIRDIIVICRLYPICSINTLLLWVPPGSGVMLENTYHMALIIYITPYTVAQHYTKVQMEHLLLLAMHNPVVLVSLNFIPNSSKFIDFTFHNIPFLQNSTDTHTDPTWYTYVQCIKTGNKSMAIISTGCDSNLVYSVVWLARPSQCQECGRGWDGRPTHIVISSHLTFI